MAWPTTSASTANLDSGSDNPGLARADIKQNIDNVNAIVAEFGEVVITSPSNGQALVYDSANSRWINSGSGGTTAAYLTWATGPSVWTVQNDQFSIVNSVSSNNLNLDAGTYDIILSGTIAAFHSNPGPEPNLNTLKLYNTTTSTDIDNIGFTQIMRTDNEKFRIYGVSSAHTFTLGATTNVSITYTTDAEDVDGNLIATLYRT